MSTCVCVLCFPSGHSLSLFPCLGNRIDLCLEILWSLLYTSVHQAFGGPACTMNFVGRPLDKGNAFGVVRCVGYITYQWLTPNMDGSNALPCHRISSFKEWRRGWLYHLIHRRHGLKRYYCSAGDWYGDRTRVWFTVCHECCCRAGAYCCGT